jgi:hypothetical protein
VGGELDGVKDVAQIQLGERPDRFVGHLSDGGWRRL